MQLFQIDVPKTYELILFGDNQEGNIAQSKDKVKECINYIMQKPNRYCIHMGDAMEAFWIEDNRYQKETCLDPPLEQMRNFRKAIEPLTREGRMLVYLMGNHELAFMKKGGNITKFICEEIQKESGKKYPLFGTYSSKVDMKDKSGLQFKLYATHGRRSINSVSPDPGRRRAYMEFILQRQLEGNFGDCLVMAKGHAHKLLVKEPTPALYLTSSKGKIYQNYTQAGSGTRDFYIPPENRWYACTGSFLKAFEIGVSTYSEIAEYAPTELGYIKIIVNDRDVIDVQEVRV